MTRTAIGLALMLTLLPAATSAQCVPLNGRCVPPTPSWTGHVATLGANAALGGLTAGLFSAIRGRDFSDAFVQGALGGVVTYGGKRLAVQRFDGAGFLGRQVGAVGASIVRNAADGVPLLDRFYLPLYLTRLEVSRQEDAGWRVQPRLDVATTALTLYGVLEDDLELDVGRSLSAGSVVFSTDGLGIRPDGHSDYVGGTAQAGVILLSDIPDWTDDRRAEIFAHERVHTLQFDQAFTFWTDPLERWLLGKAGASGLARWVHPNIGLVPFGVAGAAIPYAERPWEVEADWLAR